MKAINFLPVYDGNKIGDYLVRVSCYTWRTGSVSSRKISASYMVLHSLDFNTSI
ncbi:hypothetical protein C1H46_022928 [Malus baccata]|uniref:Uncharacterized protein n=1 Tax=Malus baccata TaxID=106549 RepID=A0A540LYA0_MALBA|nr:hypothetical protein C1H46_022928 [Malus baccata]